MVDGYQHLEEPSAFIFRVEEMNRVWKTVYNIVKEELGLELWENQWQSMALKIAPFSLQKKNIGGRRDTPRRKEVGKKV